MRQEWTSVIIMLRTNAVAANLSTVHNNERLPGLGAPAYLVDCGPDILGIHLKSLSLKNNFNSFSLRAGSNRK
jgi:hypothetical protein